MATWSDYFSLALTLLIFAGVAYFASYIYGQLNETKQWSKERLQRKGVNISKTGVSLKRKTRLANREEYFDATQRKVVKALNSARYGPAGESSMHEESPLAR
ncbi:hypothetical protein QCA50_001072 [Cerrena zonata]|uniref:ATP synthase F0 subunit 8 n=1 Tax=Cerrena zonata TaxID=2478898 RepID=A0AAW0H0F5_9APHY